MMIRILTALGLLLALMSLAIGQSSPGLIYGQVPTAGQWNSYFGAKQDTLGYSPVNRAGDTMTGRLTVPAPTTSAGLNLTPGTAPTQPVDGDLWVTNLGIYGQVNGTTVGPFSASGTGTVTSVGVSVPSFMSVTGSPVTTTGTIALAFPSRAANQVLASTDGAPGIPTFRTLTNADLASAAAGGDLSGTYSSPSVAKVNGVTYSASPSINTVPVISSANVATYEAVPNAALANSSMTIAGHSVALGGSQAIACADLSNGATGCSTATGTSGATLPLLNAANTWSGVQSFTDGDLQLKGSSSGAAILKAPATGGGTLQFHGAGTVVNADSTDTLTNKTFNSAATGNVLQVSGTTVSAGQYPGTTTNDNANAGNVGELVSGTFATGAAMTNGVTVNVGSVSLTAGDWQCHGTVTFQPNAATVTQQIAAWTSTVSATQQTIGATILAASFTAGFNQVISTGNFRINVATTTTAYLSAVASFTTNSMTTSGSMICIRTR